MTKNAETHCALITEYHQCTSAALTNNPIEVTRAIVCIKFDTLLRFIPGISTLLSLIGPCQIVDKDVVHYRDEVSCGEE